MCQVNAVCVRKKHTEASWNNLNYSWFNNTLHISHGQRWNLELLLRVVFRADSSSTIIIPANVRPPHSSNVIISSLQRAPLVMTSGMLRRDIRTGAGNTPALWRTGQIYVRGTKGASRPRVCSSLERVRARLRRLQVALHCRRWRPCPNSWWSERKEPYSVYTNQRPARSSQTHTGCNV